MQRQVKSATIMLATALLVPALHDQVRGASAPDGQQHSGRSATVAVRPGRQQGIRPTPIGVPPTPAPQFPSSTPIGVPPTLPVPGTNNNGFHHHHHHDNFVGGAYPVYVPVPVEVDPYSMYPDASGQQDSDEPPVVPGPTVFERRTPGDPSAAESSAASSAGADAAPPASDASTSQAESASSQPSQP